MTKNRSWLNLLKRLFTSEIWSKHDKEKRPKCKSLLDNRVAKKSSHAPATDATVEANVMLLSGVRVTISNPQCGKNICESAAVRIQTAFRCYLARKALRALKGIVRLQAIIRGRNVRRQAMTTLKCLQSLVNMQSQAQAKRIQMAQAKIVKMETNRDGRWDGSILTKEEAYASSMSKKEASLRRERIKEYAYNHRNSAESERRKVSGRWRYWMEQWMDTQLNKSRELEDLDSVVTSTPKQRVQYQHEELRKPRRPIHRKQSSFGDHNSFSFSPVVPAYMAATESAKAKRSMSSAKLRSTGSFDAYSESYSPCKNKLSLSMRSPTLKGATGTIKSSRTLKDLSFDSESSFKTWDHHNAFTNV